MTVHPQGQQYAPYPFQPAPYPPLFRVRVTRHIGAVAFWMHNSAVFTGTYEQCLAELAAAQRQNLAAGWWSPLSLLVMNWIALGANASERKRLQAQAPQCYAHAAAAGQVAR